MATTISVNTKSVKVLLEEGAKKPFIIPEYQRSYDWSCDEAQTLFDDIWEFALTSGGTKSDGTYFLGSIVSYENDKNEQEIIDGQQRITSLFLLLRAIYTKLSSPIEKSDEAINFMGQIQTALWRADKLTGKIDFSQTLLTSHVINERGNEILRKILESGDTEADAKDNYSNNYRLFLTLFEKRSIDNALAIYNFIYALLNQVILLPISADSQDTALTIFSTLNDRGLPLSDADIFKAKIYNNKDLSQKDIFIEQWQTLDDCCKNAGECIQNLFYYYMFYLRALNNDKATTTPGLRKYYSAEKFKNLFSEDLMNNLSIVLTLWNVINKGAECDESWSHNAAIRKLLATLICYPNEYWKYPVVIYYLKYRETEEFDKNFEFFLKKLLRELLVKYVLTSTVNAVRADILKLNAEIITTPHPKFDFKTIDETDIKEKLKIPPHRIERMLLSLLAYGEQDEILPSGWEIEHIFPKKWQDTYFTDLPDATIRKKIEYLGNKIPFEKRLNIIAGNGYFEKKKKAYADSKIKIVSEISKTSKHDWTLDDIMERSIKLADNIIDILKRWDDEYKQHSSGNTIPTQEQLAMIEEFKRQGWIK